MSSHLKSLRFYLKDLDSLSVLDLGSGRGRFLIEAASSGINITGLECYQKYIEDSYRLAEERGVKIQVLQGFGEKLPFANESFDFVNMAEVIEHVQSPITVMSEVRRVLKPGGRVYLSVPNRFGLKDQHFGLYFVNWLPRSLADIFISIFGEHKDYAGQAGHQRLADMHYFTYTGITKLLKSLGFSYKDMRVLKIKEKFKNPFIGGMVLVIYFILKPWYLDSFHILVYKV